MTTKSKRKTETAESESERVIETSPIRLSADETRLIVRVANNKGKPTCDYRAGGLVEMGILKMFECPKEDRSKELDMLWVIAYNAVGAKSLETAEKHLGKIREILKPQARKEGYVLTELGKQIARGITVRLNGQYVQSGNDS